MLAVVSSCMTSPLTFVVRRRSADVPELVTGDDHGPKWAESVEALPTRPLTIAELDVASGDVVGDRVAEDVVEGPCGWDIAHPPADDDGELNLPVDSFGERGVDHDRLLGADDARGELGEDQRALGGFDRGLLRVRAVVEADGDDLARDQRRPERARRRRSDRRGRSRRAS